jgi:hypothetical protein
MSTKVYENLGRVTHTHTHTHTQVISRNNLDLVGMPKNYIYNEHKVSLYQKI